MSTDATGPEPTVQDPRNAAPGNGSVAAPDGELAVAQKQRDEYLDQLQRSRAEFANYQKRARAQAEADRLYAVGPLALEIVNELDNFERAIEAARAAGAASIVEGLELVHRRLLASLAKHGVLPIAALGEAFDPNQHEALVQQPDTKRPEGTVVAELGKGYRLGDRVLRPTKVAVSIRPSE